MIKKISEKLKKIILILTVFALMLNIAVYNVFALENTDLNPNTIRGRDIMSQMMGANYNSSNDFMEEIMGSKGTQSMYEMMGKITASGLTVSDTQPLGSFITACQAQSTGNYRTEGMMGGWNWDGTAQTGMGVGGLFLVFGGIIMIVFWVIIILAAIALIRWLINFLKGSGTSSKAIEILKEKYAKGEITKKEFEAKKKDLM
jgi:putative membrane protein